MHAVAVTGRRGGNTSSPYSVPDLKIKYDDRGISVGQFIIGAEQKEAVDLIRNSLSLGERSLLLYGPEGGGKSLMAEQLASILSYPYVPFGDVGDAGDDAQEVKISVAANGPIDLDEQPRLRATIVANDGSGGRLFSSLVLKLDDAQLQALESLGSAKVLHVQSEDPALQTLLAKAVARTGPGQLRVQRLDGNSAEYAGHTISIHDDSTIVFEVRGQGPEDSECLEFVALRETTPILFPELRPNITEEVENGRFALPTSREESVDKEPDKRPLENALEVQRVVAELEADEAMREAIIDSLHSHLAAINEDVEGPKGRAFIERAVSNMELQAYGGDNRADRTMRLLLETIFSADQRLGVDQVQILGDSLVSLQKYSDRIYAAGEAWRTAHYPEA